MCELEREEEEEEEEEQEPGGGGSTHSAFFNSFSFNPTSLKSFLSWQPLAKKLLLNERETEGDADLSVVSGGFWQEALY